MIDRKKLQTRSLLVGMAAAGGVSMVAAAL